MTAVLNPGPGRPALLQRLLAVLRPEFRTEIYRPASGHAVFVAPPCTVDDCDRVASQRGLCNGHVIRWRHGGRPEMAEFLADPGPPVRGRRALPACRVDGCRYGRSAQKMCTRHYDRWARAGRPDPEGWDAPPLPAPVAECRLPFCSLGVDSQQKIFCHNHQERWDRTGRPDAERFITDCELTGSPHIDLRDLPRQLTMELQYGLQCRADAHRRTTPPRAVMEAIRLARAAGVSSLLDLTEEQWRHQAAAGRIREPVLFLAEVRDAVEVLRDGAGWESEYPRDVWRLERLPGITTPATASVPRPRVRLHLERIGEPWLRDLAKRWLRLRLAGGLSITAAHTGLDALVCFDGFLAHIGVARLGDIDRPLLERYLAYVASQSGGHGLKKGRISSLSLFFQAVRQHRWDDSLPGTATFYPGDIPPAPASAVSRRLAEHVMAQVEAVSNLERWDNPSGRLVTLILIRTGLRISSVICLDFDCIVRDGQDAPYLRYFNTKMKREAAVPIDEDLEQAIADHQQRVLDLWPAGTGVLFPRQHANASGLLRLSDGSYRQMLRRWLATCDIRDEHGQPVHLTPHQWRHTFACRLINRDVPQEVVRVLLDHESSRMTAHYARITDQTVRRRWEAAMKVNIQGEHVILDADGPLGQAQWAKTRYGIATQTLPNGYCGLPIQKICPHANACLTCPVFVTGPEFLPELREQHHRTLTLIDNAKSCGRTRVAEMNEQVAENLNCMINQLAEEVPDDQAETGNAG